MDKNRPLARLSSQQWQHAVERLLEFTIELPSWGFANTGTRFGKFLQDAAAVDLADRLADAGCVHSHTGICPAVAVHVLWDMPDTARADTRPGSEPNAPRSAAN